MLTEPGWADLADRLLTDPLPLVTFWADGEAVHALFLEGQDSPLLASVPVVARRYQALSMARPANAVCERIRRAVANTRPRPMMGMSYSAYS